LQGDIRKHQEEVSKAIKIHRANEKLMQENTDLKTEVKKFKEITLSLEVEV
jgi:hypothetical protein